MLIYFAISSLQSNTKNSFPGSEASVPRSEYCSKVIVYWWPSFKTGSFKCGMFLNSIFHVLLKLIILVIPWWARIFHIQHYFWLITVFYVDIITINDENMVGSLVVHNPALIWYSWGFTHMTVFLENG